MVMLRTTQAHRPERPIGGGTFGLPATRTCLPREGRDASESRPASEDRRVVWMLDGRWLYMAALPLVIWILARRRARGRARGRASTRTLVALVAVAHVAILANVALFPIPVDPVLIAAGRAAAAASSGDRGLGLIPFATIGPVLGGDALPYATRIAILNAFVLAPAGVYLPLLFRPLRAWRGLVLLAIAGGLSVEACQLAVSTVLGFHYRTIDIDDVILNAIGIVVGWLVLRVVLRVRERPARQSATPKPDSGSSALMHRGRCTVRWCRHLT
jgi:glycopeptide antibiotics resistance protein